jgi:hypothetical protein
MSHVPARDLAGAGIAASFGSDTLCIGDADNRKTARCAGVNRWAVGPVESSTLASGGSGSTSPGNRARAGSGGSGATSSSVTSVVLHGGDCCVDVSEEDEPPEVGAASPLPAGAVPARVRRWPAESDSVNEVAAIAAWDSTGRVSATAYHAHGVSWERRASDAGEGSTASEPSPAYADGVEAAIHASQLCVPVPVPACAAASGAGAVARGEHPVTTWARVRHAAWNSARNVYVYASLLYVAYAAGMLLVDYAETRTPRSDINLQYIAWGCLHLIDAFLYIASWRSLGYAYASVVMLPEFMNVLGAALYLSSAAMYPLENAPAYNNSPTMAIHVIELAASVVEMVAAVGWAYTWWLTYTRKPGR